MSLRGARMTTAGSRQLPETLGNMSQYVQRGVWRCLWRATWGMLACVFRGCHPSGGAVRACLFCLPAPRGIVHSMCVRAAGGSQAPDSGVFGDVVRVPAHGLCTDRAPDAVRPTCCIAGSPASTPGNRPLCVGRCRPCAARACLFCLQAPRGIVHSALGDAAAEHLLSPCALWRVQEH